MLVEHPAGHGAFAPLPALRFLDQPTLRSPVSERARVALSRIPHPLRRRGNGAPGGARALRYGALARPLRSGRVRADQARFARPVPRRARPAVAGLRGPPPGRCASRRSTANRIVGGPHLVRRKGASRSARSPIRLTDKISAVLDAGITYFQRHTVDEFVPTVRRARPCAGHLRLSLRPQARRGWPGQARP